MRREWLPLPSDPDSARWAPPDAVRANPPLQTLQSNRRDTHPHRRFALAPLVAFLVGASAMLGVAVATPLFDNGLAESTRRDSYSLGFLDGTEQATSAARGASSDELQREFARGVSQGQSAIFNDILPQLEAANYAMGFADGQAASD